MSLPTCFKNVSRARALSLALVLAFSLSPFLCLCPSLWCHARHLIRLEAVSGVLGGCHKHLFHQGSSHDQIEASVPFVQDGGLGHRTQRTRLRIRHLPTLRANHMDDLQELQHCIAIAEACLIVLTKSFEARHKNQAIRTQETAVKVGPSGSKAEPPSVCWELRAFDSLHLQHMSTDTRRKHGVGDLPKRRHARTERSSILS